MQANPESITLFLDAILASHPGWQLAVERTVQSFVDPTTLALLAKAHRSRLGVIDATSDDAAQQAAMDKGNGVVRLPKMSGALVVCTTTSLYQPDAMLRDLPPNAALLVLEIDEQPPSSIATQSLCRAGFAAVDAISVPHGSTFWLRSAIRGSYSPADVGLAFSRCLNNKGGMGTSQYFRVAVEILRCAPCDVLIFGAGADTALYLARAREWEDIRPDDKDYVYEERDRTDEYFELQNRTTKLLLRLHAEPGYWRRESDADWTRWVSGNRLPTTRTEFEWSWIMPHRSTGVISKHMDSRPPEFDFKPRMTCPSSI